MNMTDVQSPVLHLKLTKGQYTPVEARELVLALLKAENAFHKLQNYQIQVCHDEPCSQAEQNLSHLAAAAGKLQHLVDEAAADNGTIRVETIVRLTVDA